MSDIDRLLELAGVPAPNQQINEEEQPDPELVELLTDLAGGVMSFAGGSTVVNKTRAKEYFLRKDQKELHSDIDELISVLEHVQGSLMKGESTSDNADMLIESWNTPSSSKTGYLDEFYVVRDPLKVGKESEGEPSDLAELVDIFFKTNTDRFVKFILGGGKAALYEHVTIYLADMKRAAEADARSRLAAAKAELEKKGAKAGTEEEEVNVSSDALRQKSFNRATDSFDTLKKATVLTAKIVDVLTNVSKREENPTLKKLYKKDATDYRKVYDALRTSDILLARKIYRNLDTAAREYISDKEYVGAKANRKLLANMFDVRLLHEHVIEEAKNDKAQDAMIDKPEKIGKIDTDPVAKNTSKDIEKASIKDAKNDDVGKASTDKPEKVEDLPTTAELVNEPMKADEFTPKVPTEDEKVKIPPAIVKSLQDKVNELKELAKGASTRRKEDLAVWYEETANIFDDVLKTFKAGECNPQMLAVKLQKYSTPTVNELPVDVWKFLINGGKARSLADHFKDVKIQQKKEAK